MYLDAFYSHDGHTIRISAAQASRFAKEIAGDFNPIHNPDAKRFCVPGDLLFSLVLAQYGVSQEMTFIFTGMVGDAAELDFSPTTAEHFDITNQGKSCLRIERQGQPKHDAALISTLSQKYVAFSGQNFPHLLQPLMQAQQVMLNPDRPLVVYERMHLLADWPDQLQDELSLTLKEATLNVQGKRGEVDLHFSIHYADTCIGYGNKRLLLSGLRPYEAAVAEQLMADYLRAKANYQAQT